LLINIDLRQISSTAQHCAPSNPPHHRCGERTHSHISNQEDEFTFAIPRLVPTLPGSGLTAPALRQGEISRAAG